MDTQIPAPRNTHSPRLSRATSGNNHEERRRRGEIAKAELVVPENIIIDKKDGIIFADQRIHRVIRISDGRVSTLAGNSIIDPCGQNIGGRAQEGYQDGKALTALFNFPKGIAYDSKGNLFIADMNNHCIRKLSPDGTVTTFAK